ncbi:hypothetical protein PHYSODRAFT_346416 [Phytophthora sojae]|uniref:Heat shock factor binding protein 1 n=1 Tax=Phytophthora sojae (strain P6497) TaxID=1094619 RepID=G4ZD03_PHYSP|nr:hypothetical protein PHYSODRAFT_346416 [Phytophthora sojae]EGZ18951.1 hypothetical protein PHYSODRAFT_346416 [Phytophthora sojae]|eukprot:XP_009528009.1 hypothetical protein PHYSODRAFT_346416 [Phytophthora sojae]
MGGECTRNGQGYGEAHERLWGYDRGSSSDPAKNASANSASGAPAGGPTDAQDLTVFVQSLLEQMQSRFAQILLDEMGSRIDELEKSIADLMEQTNEDGNDKNQEPAASAPKDKGESV